jgi:amidase
MKSSDFKPAFATMSERANAVREKGISASELTNLIYQRIDRHNPRLNAIVWQDRERAMARAKDADDASAKGGAPGALHGVPVTIKESFAYRGSPNTWENGTSIEFAALLADVIGGFTPPPAFQE